MNPSRLNAILNWSMRVGSLFGIPINLHISLVFFLLPLVMGHSLGFWHTLEYVVGMVLCILLHELGHALVAKRYRMTRLSIMLHGFGGFAVASGYRTPKQALVISLAGPAVTFAIGFPLLWIGAAGLKTASFESEAFMQFFVLHYLGSINILMGCLNLLPSFPFDGGNALQAIFTWSISEIKAMRAVGHLGLVLSPALFIYGFLTGQNFIAIFGLIGAVASYTTLANSGGVRFGEFFADRRARKEMAAVRQREQAKTQAYLDDVRSREKARQERERLRKLLESSLEEE